MVPMQLTGITITVTTITTEAGITETGREDVIDTETVREDVIETETET
jgi:hypothetical protein